MRLLESEDLPSGIRCSFSEATRSQLDSHFVAAEVTDVRQNRVPRCQVPDDWLLQNRRALLFGREVLKAVMAAFTPGSQAA